ncbi:DUF493 family protein YbeD [Alteromonadales bacterium alter-6D02]|uniref:DUF493 family protein YbeD n=1 Tax=Psychrobium sp. 1_MG-2023 TaxID=3062624 RepID=UPI000C335CF7|nr:hypothetical protein CW748_13565 [Alteromonadales bacterium alter-6D02]
MDTKFDEILDFPCDFGFRIMGLAQDDLPERVNEVLTVQVPGDFKQLPGLRKSKTGKYHSISYTVKVTSKEHIETLYKELSDIDIVRYVL